MSDSDASEAYNAFNDDSGSEGYVDDPKPKKKAAVPKKAPLAKVSALDTVTAWAHKG